VWAEVQDFCSKVLDSISPIIAARATNRLQPAIPDLRVVLNRLRLPSRPHREHGALIQFSMRNVLKIFRWAWILFFFCGGLHSQVESRNRRPSSVPTRSRSGQFIVLGESSIKEDLSRNSVLVPGGPQRTVSLTPLRPMDSQGIANLTPALLSVSCERIKGELLRSSKLKTASTVPLLYESFRRFRGCLRPESLRLSMPMVGGTLWNFRSACIGHSWSERRSRHCFWK